MDIVTVDDFWPRVVTEPDVFPTLTTEDADFNARAERAWKVLEGSLVRRTENEFLVRIWEATLGLQPSVDAGLEARKAAVLTWLCAGPVLTLALLEGKLAALLGEGNFSVIHEENKLTVAVSLATTAGQIDEVQQLLGRVLPQNIVTEFDPFPCDFTRVEWLAKGASNQYIETPYTDMRGCIITCSFELPEATNGGIAGRAISSEAELQDIAIDFANNRHFMRWHFSKLHQWWSEGYVGWHEYEFDDTTDTLKVDGKVIAHTIYTKSIEAIEKPFCLMSKRVYGAAPWTNSIYPMKCGEMKFIRPTGEVYAHFVPALDNTGAPCMFDMVHRMPLYNFGGGDFTYPAQETQATTYSLRNRMYAQMTEHGIRRLYHVPAGYNGGKEEYAAEHGFKLLVETPMPEEGYWAPVWHEREDCIELEWVETEAPEEGLEP